MGLALANAGCGPDEIDYISAYGPSHPVLDAIEVEVIKRVFGRRAYLLPVSSIKGVTANALAAGGPFQVIACALAIRDRMIPPTANYEVADPACDLDFVPNCSRKARLNSTLVNVRGLGGGASSMVLTRIAA